MKKVFIAEKHMDNDLVSTLNLMEQYTHIRGYHGCRPENIEEYYNNGIVIFNQNELLHKTLHLLGDSYLSEKKLRKFFMKNI